MSDWLDDAAKAAAGDQAADEGQGLSRREALRRAGLIGAAVWAAPVVQTVLAPSASAHSHQQPGTCSGWTDANGGFCGGTGGCPKCGAGKICTSNSDCLSGECTGTKKRKTCAKSTVGEPCRSGSDCTTGVCRNGVCQSAPSTGGCQTNADCPSGHVCANGVCKPPTTGGGGCTSSKDCKNGEVCVSGVCKKRK